MKYNVICYFYINKLICILFVGIRLLGNWRVMERLIIYFRWLVVYCDFELENY